ncbi:MAG TPA: FAD/NAD(P)-binding protein [Herpetosiphonaceae bacterium]
MAGLITWGVLRHGGWPAAAMAVYGDTGQPLGQWRGYAQAIGQRQMRSESNGHVRPLDAPGLAWREAWRRRSAWPLLGGLLHCYRPRVELVVDDAAAFARQSGFSAGHVRQRIAKVKRSPAGFRLYGAAGELAGRADHLILALGHPALRWPEAAASQRGNPRITHAYQPHDIRPGSTVLVIGGGMGAAHVWIRALELGADVVRVHRQPLRRQALNAPRCQFTAAGAAEISLLPATARREAFARRKGGTIPLKLAWTWLLWRERRRVRSHVGEVAAIEEDGAGRLRATLADGAELAVDQVVCATGFQPQATAHDLLRQLIDDYRLPLQCGQLELADDFTIAQLSGPGGVCGVVGAAARWTLGAADTFVGIKYAARHLAARIGGAADTPRQERGPCV